MSHPLCAKLTEYRPFALSLLRVVTALMFLEHGLSKLFSFPVPFAYGVPPTFSLLWFAAVLEIIGGSLVTLGLCTRIVSFLLAGEMAIGYFLFHAPHSLYPMVNQGEAAIFFCFVFFYFFFAGGGPIGLDKLICRHKG